MVRPGGTRDRPRAGHGGALVTAPETMTAETMMADLAARESGPVVEPVRSHRVGLAPSWRARAIRRCGAIVLVVATLAIGSVIVSHTPGADAREQPFVRTGQPGQTVAGRVFDTDVTGVRGAAVITSDGATHDTSGVWIIVQVRLTARRDPETIGYAVLRDRDGRTYRATERFDQAILGRVLQPGVPATGEIAFEVPVTAASGLTIDLAVNEFDQRMDQMTRIVVPVTTSQVTRWRADRTATRLQDPGGLK